jgi:hypothetical protein
MMLYSMKPPPLAVNNRQVVIPGVIQFSRHFRTQQPFIKPFLLPAAHIAFDVLRTVVSLLFEADETRMSRLEKFRHRTTILISL